MAQPQRKSSLTPQPTRTSKQRGDTRESLNMRVRPEVRSLIDHAAELTGKNRTDFVLDAARVAAQNAILEQTLLPLNTEAHAAFLTLLDAPPSPSARLRKSLQTPPAWS